MPINLVFNPYPIYNYTKRSNGSFAFELYYLSTKEKGRKRKKKKIQIPILSWDLDFTILN
ncbi:hypothetical protein B0A67_23750 [Flavobacterium aquidurense]|jgi:hypothetical protein|nr:hypothetical protein B0A67_23750 [Flavobacterium aquidurense]